MDTLLLSLSAWFRAWRVEQGHKRARAAAAAASVGSGTAVRERVHERHIGAVLGARLAQHGEIALFQRRSCRFDEFCVSQISLLHHTQTKNEFIFSNSPHTLYTLLYTPPLFSAVFNG